MCGRYTITTPTKELAHYFGLVAPTGVFKANDDARPTHDLPIVLENDPKQMVLGHWGYPFVIGGKKKELINIRAETIRSKPYFKKVANTHPCVILADGFFEWKKVADGKQKYRFTLGSGPLAFAGVYEWKSKALSSEMRPFFSIITVPPNDVLAPIHDRMPAILKKDELRDWLSSADRLDLLRPYEGKIIAKAEDK